MKSFLKGGRFARNVNPMSKPKRRKAHPEMPYWYWLDQDGCWFCKNKNNCGSCKANRTFAKLCLPKKYKGRHDGGEGKDE